MYLFSPHGNEKWIYGIPVRCCVHRITFISGHNKLAVQPLVTQSVKMQRQCWRFIPFYPGDGYAASVCCLFSLSGWTILFGANAIHILLIFFEFTARPPVFVVIFSYICSHIKCMCSKLPLNHIIINIKYLVGCLYGPWLFCLLNTRPINVNTISFLSKFNAMLIILMLYERQCINMSLLFRCMPPTGNLYWRYQIRRKEKTSRKRSKHTCIFYP